MSVKTMCRGCRRTQREQHRSMVTGKPAMPSVGDILNDLPPLAHATCPCGGDQNGFRHEESLSHVVWANGR